MGTGASSASSRSPSPDLLHNNNQQQQQQRPNPGPDRKNSMFGLDDKWKGQNVICNDVAPVIISKDCFEEYQVTLYTDEQAVVNGCIKEGLPEHVLMQGKYFMVADQFDGVDELNTVDKYGAPNFRKAGGGYAVYGMGQPTALGLGKVMTVLGSGDCSDLVVVCLREEPVVFLKRDGDYIPYTPRQRDRLCENISTGSMPTSEDIAEEEVCLRKEIVKNAFRDVNNQFYFYENVEEFTNEPHRYSIKYEEHLQTSGEIYAVHTVSQSNTSYIRMPMHSDGTPAERVIDTFFSVLKGIPTLFDHQETTTPGLVFVGHIGGSRTSFAMVLGTLVLAHKYGFPPNVYQPAQTIDEKKPNLEQDEFDIVRQLCRVLPDGPQLKREVDVLIDLCDDMSNIRTDIYESKKKLETTQGDYMIAGGSSKDYFLKRMIRYLERYSYLLIVNSYLHEQTVRMFSQSFQTWMREHPLLYRLLGGLNSSELHVQATPASLIAKRSRFLVADNYIGLDVLSSQREVKGSNFRRVPGLPVFGMAQPGREALAKVVELLTSKRHSHSSIHLFTLRGELVLEIDGLTYTPRRLDSLSDNIYIPGITIQELEEKETQLKNELLKINAQIEIYQDISEPRKPLEFTSVLTLKEMGEQQQEVTAKLHYYRIATMECEGSPPEQELDGLVNIIKDLEDIYTDEDGPALLFNCDCGKERTTIAMAAAGLIVWHKKGFPVGVKLEEQERISIPQAEYTKGEFAVVMNLVRRLPSGSQVKREVDLMLDKCSETMTPMHYHLRETIFSTYNKIKLAKDEEKMTVLRQQTFNYLERYIYLILFNCYLLLERPNSWKMPFSKWMVETGRKIGVYETLDNLHFMDLDENDTYVSTMRQRWTNHGKWRPFRGTVV